MTPPGKDTNTRPQLSAYLLMVLIYQPQKGSKLRTSALAEKNFQTLRKAGDSTQKHVAGRQRSYQPG